MERLLLNVQDRFNIKLRAKPMQYPAAFAKAGDTFPTHIIE